MSGVTGFKLEIETLKQKARITARVIHKISIRLILFDVISIYTAHSSSNAAYNWHVVFNGDAVQYKDFHGISPVGDFYEGRGWKGNAAAMNEVAVAAVSRENSNIIDSIGLDSVTLFNPLPDVDTEGEYVKYADIEGIDEIISSNFMVYENSIKEELKGSQLGIGAYIES